MALSAEDDVTKDNRTTPQAVENVVDGDVSVPTDNKGRPLPEYLSERALLIEAVTHLRIMYDAISALGSNPMMAAFLPPGMPRG